MPGGLTPENTSGWIRSFLPLAQAAGPFVTLLLALMLIATLWWGRRIMRECVDHNRALSAKLVTQQEKFQTEMLVQLAHCQPRP